ncbi:MAG: hypothetical protein AAGD00_06040 [Planctomycetota bacterium]
MNLMRSGAIVAIAGLSCAATSHASVLDWGSGWTNSDPDGTFQDGAATNSTVVDGITINTTFQTFGSATGDHNFLPDSPGTATDFNGDQADDDPALSIGDSQSFNLGNAFDNFVLLTIEFSQAVSIERLTIGDNDISSGNAWQDVTTVLGSNGGSGVGVTYDPTVGPAFELRNYTFSDGSNTAPGLFGPGPVSFDGITGTSNASNDGTDGQFDVDFGGLVDTINIIYFNGPDSNDDRFRGIYIQDIEFIPTPGAAALLGVAGLAALRRKR